MGYYLLDRTKALIEDAEARTGIDCVKSVVSVKTLPEIKPLTERYFLENNANCNAKLASDCGSTTSESSGYTDR